MMGNKLRRIYNSRVSRLEQFQTHAEIGEVVLGKLTEPDCTVAERIVERLTDNVGKLGRMTALDVVSAVGVFLDQELC